METQAQGERENSQPFFSADQIVKTFGGLRAVDNVSLSMDRGYIYGLIGPNGAGKTTLFNIFTGFIRPDKGRIYYKSIDITGFKPFEIVRLGLGRTFQDVRIFPALSAIDNVLVAFPNQVGESALGGIVKRWENSTKINIERAYTLLQLIGVKEKAKEIVEDLAFPEQKLVALGRLLATEAEFLLVDEPTSGLDRRSFGEMLRFLRDLVDHKGKTICIVEHNMDLIKEICDWVFFLNQGRLIASGKPSDILRREELANIYFGRQRR